MADEASPGWAALRFWTLVKATLIIWIVNLVLDFTPGPWQITGHRQRLAIRRGRV